LPFFGHSYFNKSGKGVSKSEPEKKPFFKFCELFARKFWKFFYVNMLYVFFCLPLVTIGPATVAMTQVMRKFTLEQPIFIFEEFWNAFKKNFKQGLIIGLFDLFFIAVFILSYNYYIFLTAVQPDVSNMVMSAVFIAAGVFIFMMHFYIYPQIAALTLSLGQIIKNSLFLTVLGIKRNIITLLVSLSLIFLIFILGAFSLFLLPFVPFAWISFISVFNSYPVIQKYIITPFYESRGEKNPEIPDYSVHSDNRHKKEEEDQKPLFEDLGGRETPIKSKPKPKGKVIR